MTEQQTPNAAGPDAGRPEDRIPEDGNTVGPDTGMPDDRKPDTEPREPPAPAEHRAPPGAPAPKAPFALSRLPAAWVVAFSSAWLALGIAVGWTAASLWPSGARLPSHEDLDQRCATDPGVTVRQWTHIVLHHSASEADDAASIDRYHRKKGWQNGLGYDFVIGNGSRSGDGEIETGRRWRRQLDGAHCKAKDMNARAVGICFVGNFENGRPSDAQLHSGLALVRYLAQRFGIPPERILGHRDVDGAETLCPGRHFPMELMRAAARTP